jgi:hypothetical protein
MLYGGNGETDDDERADLVPFAGRAGRIFDAKAVGFGGVARESAESRTGLAVAGMTNNRQALLSREIVLDRRRCLF